VWFQENVKDVTTVLACLPSTLVGLLACCGDRAEQWKQTVKETMHHTGNILCIMHAACYSKSTEKQSQAGTQHLLAIIG